MSTIATGLLCIYQGLVIRHRCERCIGPSPTMLRYRATLCMSKRFVALLEMPMMFNQIGAYDRIPMPSGHKHHASRRCGNMSMVVHRVHVCSRFARHCGEWARLMVAAYTTPTTYAIATVPMPQFIQAVGWMTNRCFMTTRMTTHRYATTTVSIYNSTSVTMQLY